jgi:protein-S-isoprenylcysteine O-methyltransferase Ste14
MTQDSSRSDRGDRWVLAQLILIVLLVAALFLGPGLTPFGWVVAILGLALVVWASVTMGKSLTPFPRPKRGGELVVHGPFRFVRHPIYLGGVLVALGLSLVFSAYALLFTAALAVFWLAKARLEERHLVERFPGYADYRRRTLF